MNMQVINVGYPYVYDMYFCIQHARLEHIVYQLDFMEWVKAGIAFNIKGVQDSKRRVSYFVSLYDIVERGDFEGCKQQLRTGIVRFYEDLYQMYQEHLKAQLKYTTRKKQNQTEPDALVIIPSFDSIRPLFDILPSKHIEFSSYECENLQLFKQNMATAYPKKDSLLFRSMSVYYDYGVQGMDNGILLEVKKDEYTVG